MSSTAATSPARARRETGRPHRPQSPDPGQAVAGAAAVKKLLARS
jgi:hypothetical protein